MIKNLITLSTLMGRMEKGTDYNPQVCIAYKDGDGNTQFVPVHNITKFPDLIVISDHPFLTNSDELHNKVQEMVKVIKETII